MSFQQGLKHCKELAWRICTGRLFQRNQNANFMKIVSSDKSCLADTSVISKTGLQCTLLVTGMRLFVLSKFICVSFFSTTLDCGYVMVYP